MPVYCPKCEAATEATSKFCLQCGQDYDMNGPITSTGHDVKALKESIRARDDLSMADKFDLIAQVEDGANPIELGIAASADDAEEAAAAPKPAPAPKADGKSDGKSEVRMVSSPAAAAAVASVSQSTDAWAMVMSGRVNISDPTFRAAMDLGMDASHHIHDISHGGIDETDLTNEDLRAIPVLKPPKRSFCPKCGSDILSHSHLQWKKWREHSAEVVQLQAQAAMEAAIVQVASHYVGALDALEIKNKELEEQLGSLDEKKIIKKIEPRIKEQVRAQLEKEYKSKAVASGTAATSKSKAKPKKTKAKAKSSGTKKKPSKAAAMFGGGPQATKKFEGKKKDKPDWFLKNALDIVFDPHGTGKALKPKTILARSSDGNVRVQDVVTIYASDGEDGLSELAWTSPFTRYIIEAYDSC
jgi:hypothetical protein